MNNWFNASLIIGADFTSDIRKQSFERGSRTRSTGASQLNQFTTYLYDAIINITGGDEIAENLNFNYLFSGNAFSYQGTSLSKYRSDLAFQGFVNLANASNITGGEGLFQNTQM